jgi:hypothetical protein
VGLLLLVPGLAGAPAPAAGQETIASDRPGIGSASVVVAPGVAQAEFGAAVVGAGGSEALALGQLFVRYGLAGVEAELLVNSYRVGLDDAADGFEDVAVGAKVPIARGVGGRADLSLQGLVTLPTGAAGVGGDAVAPTVVALADIGLAAGSALSVNVAGTRGSGAVPDQILATVTPSLALSDRSSGYAGWAATFSEGADVHWLEGGVAFFASPDVQLDVNGAASLDTDQWFVGVGMAVRTGAR